MAMLAGPRKKTRYTLTPKGKPLFEDSDRFGTKMLEKMGWEKGKGLGKYETGNQEFVRLKYKSDEQGLGFEERDDQWTEHEKNFNGLLENLNGEKTASDEDEIETIRPGFGVPIKEKKSKKLKDKISGQSLEEKSKTSKARVHYKKFTKGKDMSQYSEKDLANIFGKKATPEEADIYSQFQAFNANVDDGNDAAEKTEVNDNKPEIPRSTPIINTGVSVNDYFKSKMAALKEKYGHQKSSNPFDGNNRTINNFDIFIPTKRKTRSDEEQSENEESENPCKKRRKSKKLDVEDTLEREEKEDQSEIDAPRKKKKNKNVDIEEPASVVETLKSKDETSESKESEAPTKKKKTKRLAVEETAPVVETSKLDDNVEETVSKKKNKKSKKESIEEIEVVPAETNEEEPPKKKKKSKKTELVIEPKADNVQIQPDCHSEELTSSKKKKKSKNPPSVELVESTIVPPVEEVPKKKKKKDKKEPDSDESAQKENHIEPLKNNTNEESSSQEDQLKSISKKKLKKAEVSPPKPILATTYKISTFCAEKFRVVEIQQFPDSNLSNIVGYGLSEDLKLIITENHKDVQRITRLWNGTLDKYTHATVKHKVYSNFMDKVKIAKKSKNKIPQFKLRNLKRKQVFQCV